jgi:hypothetical protein
MFRFTTTTTIAPITAKAILRVERFFSLGWSASDRFFLHLPDLVLSLSFDHLPFFTLGAGKISPSLVDFSAFLPYIFNNTNRCRNFLRRLTEYERRKLKLSLFFY